MCEAEELDQEVTQVFRVQLHTPASLIQPGAGENTEQVVRELVESVCLRLVPRREPKVVLDLADVAVANEVPQERANAFVDPRRDPNRRTLVHRQRQREIVFAKV